MHTAPNRPPTADALVAEQAGRVRAPDRLLAHPEYAQAIPAVLKRLRPAYRRTLRLFHTAATLLQQAYAEQLQPFQRLPTRLTAALETEDALARLVALGLLEAEAKGEQVLHRLVGAFVDSLAVEEEARAAVERMLLAETRRLNRAGFPATLLAWQPHLRTVADAAQRREDEARQRGAKNAYLDTFSFQAPDFYKRHGYRVFGELGDFPTGHQRFFLTKQL